MGSQGICGKVLDQCKRVLQGACLPPMKTLIALIIFGWVAVVTFFGPELARAINGPEPVKTHRTR